MFYKYLYMPNVYNIYVIHIYCIYYILYIYKTIYNVSCTHIQAAEVVVESGKSKKVKMSVSDLLG